MSDKAVDKPAEKPVDNAPPPAEKPVDAEKPAEKPSEKPADAAPEVKPDGEPAAKPDDKNAKDAKPSDGKTPEDKPAEGQAQTPEIYELELPENSLLSEDYVEKLSAYAKEQKLSNVQAQALLTREHSAAQAGVEAMMSNAKKMSEEMLTEAKADKEIGGERFAQTVADANEALEVLFPGIEIRKIMDTSGLGNNKVVLKGFAQIAKMLKNDKFESTGAPPPKRTTSVAQRLYDHPTSQKS